MTAVTDQWVVHTYCDILVTCLEAKGQWCIYPAMKILCSPTARCFFMYVKLIRHCLDSNVNTAGLLHWQTQIALSQTDSCCLSFVPMINALKIFPGSAQRLC